MRDARRRWFMAVLAVATTAALGPAVVAAAEALPEPTPTEAAPPGEAAAPAPPAEPFSIQTALEDLGRKFRAGGLTMWVILFLSVAALAFALERLFRLRRGVVAPAGLARQADVLWHDGAYDEIEALCRRRSSTLARIIRFMVRHRDKPTADVNEAISDIASADMTVHTMLTYPLAAVATLSPLLGLFGTVLGMIESFEMVALAGAMGDPQILASGISKALVTTAFGLFVAIPSLFFYHLFRLRTNYLTNILDRQVTDLSSRWLLGKEASE